MKPTRNFPSAPAAITAAAVLVAMGLLILAVSRPHDGQEVQSAARALVARGDSSNASSPRALLRVMGGSAPSGDAVRLVSADGHSIGQPLKAGLWTTAVSPTSTPAAGVASVELSQPGASGGQGFGREVLIGAIAVALLGLLAAFGAAARTRASREPPAHGGDQGLDTARTRIEPRSSNGDRRPLVSALILVVETMPDSPAGARAVRTLKQVGVETIEPKPGAAFDSRLHRVCGLVEAPDPGLADSVAAVVRPGFIDHGFVLREADVQIFGTAREQMRTVPSVS